MMGIATSLCLAVAVMMGDGAPSLDAPTENVPAWHNEWHEYLHAPTGATGNRRADLHSGVGSFALRVAFLGLPPPLEGEALADFRADHSRVVVEEPSVRLQQLEERRARIDLRNIQRRRLNAREATVEEQRRAMNENSVWLRSQIDRIVTAKEACAY